MEIQVLTKFQLKITLIGEVIATSVILLKIAKFERIYNFSDLNHINRSIVRVSTQNHPNWRSYWQKVILLKI